MIDLEKVIKRLEWILENDRFGFGVNWEAGEPRDDYEKAGKIITDTIALLKEQEAITVDTKVIGTFNGDVEVYCCRDCRTILDPAFHYCPNCGRAVKWE